MVIVLNEKGSPVEVSSEGADMVMQLRKENDFLRVEVGQMRALAANAHKAWDADQDSRTGKLLRAMLDPEFRKGYRPDLYAERQEN